MLCQCLSGQAPACAPSTVDNATARHGKGLCRDRGDLVARHDDIRILDQICIDPFKHINVGKQGDLRIDVLSLYA